MPREYMYMMGCLFAVNRMIERGSSYYEIRVDDKCEISTWNEVKEWIKKQYGIEKELEE